MSYFILYFEQRSKNGTHHDQCKDINVYSIDGEISEGTVSVMYKGANVESSILSSRMDATLFYIFNKPTRLVSVAQRVRDKLFKFLKGRVGLGFDCYFFVLDLPGSWPAKVSIVEPPVEITISELEDFFKSGIKTGLFKILK